MPYRHWFLFVSCIVVHTVDVFGVEKGVSSSGCVNLFLASAILKSRKDEKSEEKRVI